MSIDGRLDPLPAAESSEPAPEAPATRSERVIALDVLRGLAILGTLATNIGFFVWIDKDLAIGETLDLALSLAYGLVTNGYWIGLLTIMFGIGLMIQRQSALRRGDPWLASYPWRAVLLIVEGFLNYLFVVPFDVLMGYGLTALVVCVVLVTPKRVQTVVLALGLVAHVAHLAYLGRQEALWLARNPTDFREMSGASDRMLDRLSDDRFSRFEDSFPEDLGFSYWEGVRFNLETFWSGGRAEIPIMFIMGIGVFLIGARLWEAGIFRPDGGRLRKRVMWVGLGIGLPLDWGLRAAGMFFPETIPVWTFGFVRYFTATVVAVGVLALVAHFYAGRERTGPVGSILALVGRTALSCYLLQNILGLVLFSDFALDLDSKMPVSLGTLNLVIAFAIVSAILIVFAKLWLSRFEMGPMETVSHTAHRWLVRNTTERVLARRRNKLAAEAGTV
jgi:uncharacterized protein